jgi:hypothetical protein
MSRRDHSAKAASIVDDLIARADGIVPLELRDPLRTVIRIAFEVLELLDSTVLELLEAPTTKQNALDWTHETICAGCESVLLARDAWRLLGQLDGMSFPGPGEHTLPTDVRDLHIQLETALRTLQDDSLPITARLRAVNRAARLQLVFLGSTLW